ncbi:MAG: CocE/NonD family hydrolase [Deltaproteobacteria bacterium]|nr:CocE/NonD family hydrolase [Deltaproteobacteria bacterium]
MEDGVRLATRVFSPLHGNDAPTVLIRTPHGSGGELSRDMLLGRLIAEAGYHAVVQDVRGRWDSEGSFVPFANEARDGAETLAWILQQPWGSGGIGLVGSSYGGHAAWAALSAAPDRVQALVVVMGAADLYPAFHPGGAFSLATALDWATRVGDRVTTPRGHIDLDRGLRHRPIRESDRVALRRIDWFRDWIDHPQRDAYWEGLAARLPDRPPPSLLIAGWYDFFLGPQLHDHAELLERTRGAGPRAPRLVIGPWSHGHAAHPRWRSLKRGFLGVSLRETLSFLDHHLAGAPADAESASGAEALPGMPVRFFMGGGDEWRSSSAWPPPETRSCALYLRAGGEEGGSGGREELHGPTGALSWDPPAADEAPTRFESDGEDPVPSVGGAFFSSRLWGRGDGAAEQSPLDGRSDLVRFTGEGLEEELEIAGRVKLVLHALDDAGNTEDADFTAKLVDLAPDGSALNLCEGILRCRQPADLVDATKDATDDAREDAKDAGQPTRNADKALEIDLWACAWRFRRGHRIRLEVASASFPRFARGPAAGDSVSGDAAQSPRPTRQTLFHDPDRPSHLVLPVVGGLPVAGTARDAPHATPAATPQATPQAKGPPG